MSLRIVVARHEEDVGWLNAVPKRWHVSVVKKGVHLPNTGREASSYLWAMENVCFEDDGWVMFLQGDPFSLLPGGRLWVGSPYAHLEPEYLMGALAMPEFPPSFVWLGRPGFVTERDGSPHHPGLPVGEWHDDICEAPWPEKGIEFAPGAQFVVPAWMIRGKKKDKIRALREKVDAAPETGAWCMERLWHTWLT